MPAEITIAHLGMFCIELVQVKVRQWTQVHLFGPTILSIAESLYHKYYVQLFVVVVEAQVRLFWRRYLLSPQSSSIW